MWDNSDAHAGRKALTNVQHNIPTSITSLLGQEWDGVISILIPQVSIHSKPGAPVSAILEGIHCKHLAPVWSIAALVVCEQVGDGALHRQSQYGQQYPVQNIQGVVYSGSDKVKQGARQSKWPSLATHRSSRLNFTPIIHHTFYGL